MWIIRRPVLFILAFALLFSLAEPGRAAAPESGGEVVGYYASWAAGQGCRGNQILQETHRKSDTQRDKDDA